MSKTSKIIISFIIVVAALSAIEAKIIYANKKQVLSLLSFETNQVSGRYSNNGTGLIRSITFDRSTGQATLGSPFYAFTGGTLSFPYVENDGAVYIQDPQKGNIAFIKNKGSLECNILFFGKSFTKEN